MKCFICLNNIIKDRIYGEVREKGKERLIYCGHHSGVELREALNKIS